MKQKGTKFKSGTVDEWLDCGNIFQWKGKVGSPIEAVSDFGASLVRFRIWNNPTGAYGNLDDVVRGIQDSKQYQLSTLANFHFSDTFADPSKQIIPLAWVSVAHDVQLLSDSLYNYVFSSLENLYRNGSTPEFIQLGNEVDGNILLEDQNDLYPVDWERNSILFKAAFDAVNDFKKIYKQNITKIHHLSDPEVAFNWLHEAVDNDFDLDFAIVGISFYPQFSTQSISETMNFISQIKNDFNKNTLIVETGYPWTQNFNDIQDNFIALEIPAYSPASEENQYLFLRDLMQNTMNTSGGLGVLYWAPDYITSTCKPSPYENATLFDFNNDALAGLAFLNYPYDSDVTSERTFQFTVFPNPVLAKGEITIGVNENVSLDTSAMFYSIGNPGESYLLSLKASSSERGLFYKTLVPAVSPGFYALVLTSSQFEIRSAYLMEVH